MCLAIVTVSSIVERMPIPLSIEIYVDSSLRNYRYRRKRHALGVRVALSHILAHLTPLKDGGSP